MPSITGFSHLALTVTDVDRSFDWYDKLLGMQELFGGDENGIKFRVNLIAGSNLILGLRQHQGSAGDRFDESRVGMDHVAFQVSGRSDLTEWESKLEELGVDHSEIKDTDYGSVLTFRDPDNIQLEFFSLPG